MLEPRRRFVLSLLLAAVGASGLTGQVYSAERHRLLPVGGVLAARPADLDGDGDLDLVWPLQNTLVAWNDGDGRFVAGASHSGLVVWSRAVDVGDVDGDGDLDVVFGGYYFFLTVPVPPVLFRNLGGGAFAETQLPSGQQQTIAVHLVDYDGDGDLDLVECNAWAGQFSVTSVDRLLENDGAGNFTDVSTAKLPSPFSDAFDGAVADLDGDGLPEFVTATRVGSSGSEIRIRKRTPTGQMALVPGAVPASPPWNLYRSVAVADVDQDGDLDLITQQNAGPVWFPNSGAGVFGSMLPLSPGGRPTPVDLDRDGVVDLLCAGDDGLTLLQGTGGGAFVDATASAVESAACGDVEIVVFDADGDGDEDVVARTWPQLQPCIWHNDGAGNLWQLATREVDNVTLADALCADADGDGWPDLAAITDSVGDPRVLFFRGGERGPGLASEVLAAYPYASGSEPQTLAWIDVDGDGDLDLFVGGRQPGDDRLFRLDPGGFVDVTATALPPQATGTRRVVVADLDGDGLEDLVASGPRWLRNVGGGSFVDASAAFPAPTAVATDVTVLDVDLDGDLDVVATQRNGSSATGGRVIRNDGAAGFADATPAAVAGLPSSSVAATDLDGDGAADLVFGVDAPFSGANGVVVLRVTPAGLVDETAQRVPVVPPNVHDLVVDDYDRDGHDDVLAYSTGQVSPFRNVGGVLQGATFGWPYLGGPAMRRPVAADLDGDCDVDLIGANGTVRSRVRDVQDSVPPRLGRSAELVVHANGGSGGAAQGALVFVGDQRLPQPVPLGSLGLVRIDPATASLVASLGFPGPLGEQSVAYVVPNAPALLGSDLFVQALFLHGAATSSWRLSNLVVLRVRA